MLRPLAVDQPDEPAYITMSTTGTSGPGDYFTNPLWKRSAIVLGEVGFVVMLGLVIGSIGAQFASEQVSPFLYGTEPADPTVHVAAVTLLATVAFIVGLIPAPGRRVAWIRLKRCASSKE